MGILKKRYTEIQLRGEYEGGGGGERESSYGERLLLSQDYAEEHIESATRILKNAKHSRTMGTGAGDGSHLMDSNPGHYKDSLVDSANEIREAAKGLAAMDVTLAQINIKVQNASSLSEIMNLFNQMVSQKVNDRNSPLRHAVKALKTELWESSPDRKPDEFSRWSLDAQKDWYAEHGMNEVGIPFGSVNISNKKGSGCLGLLFGGGYDGISNMGNH